MTYKKYCISSPWCEDDRCQCDEWEQHESVSMLEAELLINKKKSMNKTINVIILSTAILAVSAFAIIRNIKNNNMDEQTISTEELGSDLVEDTLTTTNNVSSKSEQKVTTSSVTPEVSSLNTNSTVTISDVITKNSDIVTSEITKKGYVTQSDFEQNTVYEAPVSGSEQQAVSSN